MKHTILLIVMAIFLFSCTKNTEVKVEKQQVTVNVKGKPIIADATLTHFTDGHSSFSIVGGGKNLLFLQITPNGLIQDIDLPEPELLRCMKSHARLCRQQIACSILCVGGANISCVFGWFIGCGLR